MIGIEEGSKKMTEHVVKKRKQIPEITTNLRKDYIKVPDKIRNASGIKIMGRRIKSILFTTDIAIILNNNADAILAVYPFTPPSSHHWSHCFHFQSPSLSRGRGWFDQGTAV